MLGQILLSLASGALQMAMQNKAAERQRRATREAQARQTQFQDRARQVVDDSLQQYENPKRVEKGVTIEGEILDRHTDALDKAAEQGMGEVRQSVTGNVSDAYETSRAQSTKRRTENALALAKLMSKVAAPGRLRQDEALLMGDTASQLNTIGNFSRGQAGVDKIGIEEAGRGNQLGSLLLGNATGYLQGKMQ